MDEAVNACFAFCNYNRLRVAQCPKLCENDRLPVNPELVRDLLLQLDPYKPKGPDGIHLRTLKELADVIVRPLSMTFEQSFEPRVVPVDQKLANVPIFKKGKKDDPGNYTLVNLTSVPGKVMKIALRGIETHLNDNSYWSQPAWFHDRKVLLV